MFYGLLARTFTKKVLSYLIHVSKQMYNVILEYSLWNQGTWRNDKIDSVSLNQERNIKFYTDDSISLTIIRFDERILKP